MAEPKKRHTSSRSGKRRSHLALKSIPLTTCPKCKAPVQSHRVCPLCGHYKGSDILELEKKAKAKEERKKQKEKEDE